MLGDTNSWAMLGDMNSWANHFCSGVTTDDWLDSFCPRSQVKFCSGINLLFYFCSDTDNLGSNAKLDFCWKLLCNILIWQWVIQPSINVGKWWFWYKSKLLSLHRITDQNGTYPSSETWPHHLCLLPELQGWLDSHAYKHSCTEGVWEKWFKISSRLITNRMLINM